MTGGWRQLHNEELNALCSLPNIISDQIEKNNLGGASSTYGGEEGCIQRKAEVKRPLGIPRPR